MLKRFLLFLTLTACSPLLCAHHVLGRPAYSLDEDSTTPPSMQVETQIGKFYITYMVFPAFPSPNEGGRINLYARRIDTGAPYNGNVTFRVRDDSLFNDNEETLGTQPPDDNVFRQGFEFRNAGDYIIRAEFEYEGEPYQIDFPLRIGEPSAFGPIGITVGIIIFVLLAVNLLQKRRVLTEKIKTAHENNRS